jgi:hypothetical protein
MCLSRKGDQSLILNLNNLFYRSQYNSIANNKVSDLSRVRKPYCKNTKSIECRVKTPITEIQHRDCVICHLDQKLEKYSSVNDKKAAFVAVLGCCIAICSAIALLIIASGAASFILLPIATALLSIACVAGMSSALLGVAILANRFLLEKKKAELDVSVMMSNFLQFMAKNIEVPRDTQNKKVLQTSQTDLDRLIRENECAGSISKLRKLHHDLDGLEKQQEQLRVRIASEETSPKKKEAYNKRLSKNSENIELKYKAVKTLSETLYTKIFSGLEGMCHQDYKEEFTENKHQYILELTSSSDFSANLYGMIFAEQYPNKEAIARFKSSKFLKGLLSGVSLIEQKDLFRSIN